MPDSQITVIGNITRDPETGYTTNGQMKTKLGIAVNRRWQNKTTQEWEEETSFFNVVCWRELAENVAASLVKGARIIVNGRLEQRTWETSDGEKKQIFEIVADAVGPDLRWATASVVRTPKSGGPVIPKTTPAPDVHPDEEPF